jgi:hypothetical protein
MAANRAFPKAKSDNVFGQVGYEGMHEFIVESREPSTQHRLTRNTDSGARVDRPRMRGEKAD